MILAMKDERRVRWAGEGGGGDRGLRRGPPVKARPRDNRLGAPRTGEEYVRSTPQMVQCLGQAVQPAGQSWVTDHTQLRPPVSRATCYV